VTVLITLNGDVPNMFVHFVKGGHLNMHKKTVLYEDEENTLHSIMDCGVILILMDTTMETSLENAESHVLC
jgi:hypothetical protein